MLTPIQLEDLHQAQVLAAANTHAGQMGQAVVAALLAALALFPILCAVRQMRRAHRRAACAKYLGRAA